MDNRAKKESPEKVAKLILAKLKEKADPKKAAQGKKFFKEEVKLYGISAKDIYSLEKDVYQRLKPSWDFNDAVRLCEILLPNPYTEAKSMAILILERFSGEFPRELFFKVEEWLSSDYCDNWAVVDSLCPQVMESLFIKFPKLSEKITGWTLSPNRWLRRASAVSFILLTRKGRMLDAAYKISERLFRDKDDLVQKANGWLLREAGKTDEKRLESFLLKRGARIPRTTLRYAIERFEEKKRKRILTQTKPEGKNQR
jgi:3-methyladenine DNA glycosylase AlkD